MRPMPPNATQTLTMQQSSAPVQSVNQSVQPQPPPAGGASNSRVQQNSKQAGGQRAAFKISTSRGASPPQADPKWRQASAKQPSRSSNQQQQYVPSQNHKDTTTTTAATTTATTTSSSAAAVAAANSAQPQPLECSTATGLTTTTTSTLGEPDDPSECSCSNSFDCLTDDAQLTRSNSSQLPPPPPPLEPQLRHQPQDYAYGRPHQHQHHHHHHHQQQHLTNYHSPHLHHQHHNQPHHHQPPAHHMQHMHQPLRQQHQHPGGRRPSLDDDCAFRNANQSHHQPHPQHHIYQPQLPAPSVNQHHHHHYQPQQHQHRPLLPHASMPPLRSGGGGFPAAPSPPPLMRHSTYTATSDTITDDSPLHRAPHQNYFGTSGSGDGGGGGGGDETDLLIGKQKQVGASFRRTANSREAEVDRWRPLSSNQPPQQQHPRAQAYSGYSEGLQSNNELGGSLSRHSNHQRNPGAQYHSSQKQQGRRQRHGDNHSSTATNSAFHEQQSPMNQQQQARLSSNSNDGGTVGDGSTGDNYRLHSAPTFAGTHNTSLLGTQSTNINIGGTGGTAPTNTPATHASPFEAAATFCPPLMTIPPPPLPIGPLAITSHRTNSPWMRLSSIILTPVGIVVAFFIVISPLLHYLM